MTFAIVGPKNDVGDQDGSIKRIEWTGGTTSDAGAGVELTEWADVCVQADGTIAGATVNIEGSNDGTTWATLNNAQGTALSFTALPAIKQIVERPRYIRPSVVGGTSPTINVRMILRRANPMRT